MSLNYFDTLIAVADDCPTDRAEIPVPRGNKITVAMLHYRMISEQPYEIMQEEILFQTWFQRQTFDSSLAADEIAQLRKTFFSTGQPCLRTSPLGKRYGWGLHFDKTGKVALCPVESDRYRELLDTATVVKAMRSKRV